MNPDSTRKAIRRSILKQEGARRVDVMLSAESLDDLAAIRKLSGFDTAEAIAWALGYVREDTKIITKSA
jgi:hypothetical protein